MMKSSTIFIFLPHTPTFFGEQSILFDSDVITFSIQRDIPVFSWHLNLRAKMSSGFVECELLPPAEKTTCAILYLFVRWQQQEKASLKVNSGLSGGNMSGYILIINYTYSGCAYFTFKFPGKTFNS